MALNFLPSDLDFPSPGFANPSTHFGKYTRLSRETTPLPLAFIELSRGRRGASSPRGMRPVFETCECGRFKAHLNCCVGICPFLAAPKREAAPRYPALGSPALGSPAPGSPAPGSPARWVRADRASPCGRPPPQSPNVDLPSAMSIPMRCRPPVPLSRFWRFRRRKSRFDCSRR